MDSAQELRDHLKSAFRAGLDKPDPTNRDRVVLNSIVKRINVTEQSLSVDLELFYKILINVSSTAADKMVNVLLNSSPYVEENFISVLWSYALNRDNTRYPELVVSLILNLTRNPSNLKDMLKYLPALEKIIYDITRILLEPRRHDDVKYYQLLSHLLLNISVLPQAQKILISQEKIFMLQILELLENTDVLLRRNTCAIIKNLSLIEENHGVLLDDYHLLGPLLRNLFESSSSYTDEEILKFPEELQYVKEITKENDVEIRKLTLEILYQLCATRQWRDFIRNKNSYLVLRDYHKSEEDENCLSLCEDVVNLLIRTEEEIGADNLYKLELPKEIAEKFSQ